MKKSNPGRNEPHTKSQGDGKKVKGSRNGRDSAAAAAAGNSLAVFEKALRLFNSRRFSEAKELFETVRASASLDLAHKAGVHVTICERRLGMDDGPQPSTLEEHYNYAVAMINARNLPVAERHLAIALDMDAQADHVHYALALCRGLAGDLQGAYDNLKNAIDLHPRNRVAARNDADFAPLAARPPLSRLVFPERS
ncbi:MAG: hypothetical protein WD696_05360 [Bryobacteraceae bacterium]